MSKPATKQKQIEWMQLAISLANSAAYLGEVPVGAVIVSGDQQLLATAINLKEQRCDAGAHAEMLAVSAASRQLKAWRLTDCEIYVTLEPCLMCAGALYQARIKKVNFGAFDPKHGALGSLYSIHQDARLNHELLVEGGIEGEACARLMVDFFKARRTSLKSD